MGYHLTPWVASRKNRSFLGLNDITDAAIRFLPPWVGCFESCTNGRKNPMKHWMSLSFPWWKDGNKHVFMHFHFRMAAHEFFHCQLHFLSICLESVLVLCFAFLLPPFFFLGRGDPIVRRCWARTEDLTAILDLDLFGLNMLYFVILLSFIVKYSCCLYWQSKNMIIHMEFSKKNRLNRQYPAETAQHLIWKPRKWVRKKKQLVPAFRVEWQFESVE